MAKTISGAFRGMDKAIRQGTARALNRAIDAIKTDLAKELREDTGLKSERIKKRMLVRRASPDRMRGAINIAIKVGVALREFAPKEKKVRVNKRTYLGVTVKIGKQPRQLVPGAFPLVGKTGEAVLIRKLSYSGGKYTNPRAKDYPLAQPRHDIAPAVQNRAKDAQKNLQSEFDKRVAHEINFAVSKKFKADP